ncbi:ylmG-like protein 2, chloroplastic [Quillaja saponaria]|uniref:YlmG-like protein 2, chloroplastic n=1 Tax=Quillaja saponaria TaxID=32244 RepID=A0AAD7PKT0_QUISA|nr:ylmG-like protein 2, chloroplastic [Quillaja saponaria]KAJ7958410.1 ylmG-like protein 2, chloroplastic [Quillaja saponaria]
MAMNESSTENVVNKETMSYPKCSMLTSAISQTPFALPFLRVSNFKPSTSASPNINLRELHRSITSMVDNFLRFVHLFASENPVVKKVVSLSSEFQSLCKQIHYRNNRNMVSLSSHNFAAVLPGDSVAGLVVANGISSFLNIYNTLLIVRLVLTWFPNSPPAIVSPLSTICDPYLNIFRGLIPPLGGTLDLSPILAFIVLNAFTSTAAALPAEIPTEKSQERLATPSWIPDLTSSQKKWMRRLNGNRSKTSGGGN